MLSLVVVIIMLAIVVLFTAQNAGPVAVSFFVWKFEASLAIVIALSLLSGMLVGMTALSLLRMRRSARRKSAPERGPASSDKPV